jgi:hypothetical protein
VRGLGSEFLCESVLVNDATPVEFLEDRWGYPGLQDQPAAQVDSSDFLSRAPIESLSSLVEQLPLGVLVGMPCNDLVVIGLTEQPELLPRRARGLCFRYALLAICFEYNVIE